MRFQPGEGFCAPGAVHNAAKAIGRRISIKKLSKAMGTTKDGTDEDSLVIGARDCGLVATKYSTTDQVAAWAWLIDCLRNEKPVVACVMNWNHWIAIVGTIGNRIIAVDSSNTVRNKKENGVHTYSRKEWMKRWTHSGNGDCSGVCLSKK